jgi:hypothetical protein
MFKPKWASSVGHGRIGNSAAVDRSWPMKQTTQESDIIPPASYQ